jgi:hypothetical protein
VNEYFIRGIFTAVGAVVAYSLCGDTLHFWICKFWNVMLEKDGKNQLDWSCEKWRCINPLNAELNPICYLLALLGVHHFLHVSRIRVN